MIFGATTPAKTPLASSPSGNYAVLADTGVYTITGNNVRLLYGRRVAANQGSYALNGVAVNLEYGHRIPADVGSYAITGNDVLLKEAHRLVVGVGSYAYSGVAVRLLHGYPLIVGPGSYTISGKAVILRKTWNPLLAGVGSYSITGRAVLLEKGTHFRIGTGEYNIFGRDTNVYIIRLGDQQIYVHHSGAWKQPLAYAKFEGDWHLVWQGWVKYNGIWESVYLLESDVDVSIHRGMIPGGFTPAQVPFG
jgi:hypothetical protein